MLVKTADLLKEARKNKYAVGAFNIYNLEGAAAVVQTAEEADHRATRATVIEC